MEMRDQLHVPAALTQGKNPGTHWTWGWVVRKRLRRILAAKRDEVTGHCIPR
jgi:hypothetical protein